jgi:sulfoxide reductase heme-binding subunit YedZ
MPRLRFTPLQVLVHAGALFPFLLLLWDGYTGNLTVNPIQAATYRTGKTALVLLAASLACTPLATLAGFREALKIRRALGLWAFFYVCLHLGIFVVIDFGLDWELIYEGIAEKRYALVGFAAFLLLLPLALTSTRGWMKRLGQRWKQLHRLVYVAAGLVIVHFVWSVKSDVREPLLFGAAIAVLLALRLPAVRRATGNWRYRLARRGRRPASPEPASARAPGEAEPA